MTSNNQVSPVIRISRGERDASARATHLKAASKKYLETTIERKQMSTTTNFKRIALVAVAALGLGVLSSVPSQAATNADTLVLSATTAAQNTAETYTSTSATATISFIGSAVIDSMSLTASLQSGPAGTTALPYLRLIETTTAAVDSVTATGASKVAGDAVNPNTAGIVATLPGTTTATATGAKFAVYLGKGSSTVAPTVVGTYVVKLTPAVTGGTGTLQSAAQTVTITVTEAAALDTKAAAATTKVYIQDSNQALAIVPTTDSTVVKSKTPSQNTVAVLYIRPYNAAGGTAVNESLTVATNAGSLGTAVNTPLGRSLNVIGGASATPVYISPDGTSGTATITVTSAAGVLLATKTMTFHGALASFAAPTIAATDSTVVAVNGTTKVSVKALDSAATLVSNLTGGTDIYAFSDSAAVASVATYAFSSTTGNSVIVTGLAAGVANITFGNASTLAASTIKSTPIAVRVGSSTANSVTVAFDKTAYVPGEKATLTITVLDAKGLKVAGDITYSDIFATGGLAGNMGLTNSSPDLTGTSVLVNGLTNTKTYTVYMPATGGSYKLSWTGGTALAAANQVAGSTTVTVTDAASSALAAVTALATTVASLRTLIVTLTNLVLKIQKKVKA
jgi:trimeric autotransporter adhesin